MTGKTKYGLFENYICIRGAALLMRVNAQTQQSPTKISNNSVVQALHLKEIYVAPSAWRAVFQ
ncbi:MAG: hypothetical protein V7K21_26175 [Nostoc sp.]|uniref:hypothetical protein n=1 Tax=Nostoc sp. TaxID=1180 RepID=UPI002FF56C1E